MAMARNPRGMEIHKPDSNSDSGDNYSTKSKLPILTRHNWYKWRSEFENLLISKGHEELLDPKWIQRNSDTKKYRQKTALAIHLLFGSVDQELKGYVTPHRKDFPRASEELKKACGKDSLIVIGNQVLQLVYLLFQPNTSIRLHSVAFHEQYLALKETLDGQTCTDQEDSIRVSSPLAAILFLKSFRLDTSLNSLVQLCHDIRPFRFERVYDCLLAKDTRCKSKNSELVLHVGTSGHKPRPPRQTPRAVSQATITQPPAPASHTSSTYQPCPSPRPAIPTRGQPNSYNRPNGASNLASIERRLNSMMDEFKRLKSSDLANLIDKGKEDSTPGEHLTANLTIENNDVKDCGFLIDDDVVYNVSPCTSKSTNLVYDSGATKSTMCNSDLLTDLKPCNKEMNTYRVQIHITHIGTLSIGPVSIHPVYYAPMGPRNLISASQLKDHGLKVIHQHQVVLIKAPNSVILTFRRAGNLYVANFSHRLPSINSIADNPTVTNWHVTLGHPSDTYLQKFLELYQIKSYPQTHRAIHCAVCKTSKRGHQYILVLIDNFTQFNRVYVLRNKSNAKTHIISYFNKIKNQFDRFPAVFHSDRGAKRFNQTLLTKLQCVMAQSNIPLVYWDEATKYCSILINHLPSKALNWQLPTGCLASANCSLEPVRDIHRLLPFGLKVAVYNRTRSSKIAPTARNLLFVGYKSRSDAARFLDTAKGVIVVSRDFTPAALNFQYNSPEAVRKPPSSLPSLSLTPASAPSIMGSNKYVTIGVGQPSPHHRRRSKSLTSNAMPLAANILAPTSPREALVEPTEVTSNPAVAVPPPPTKKGYGYVPYYEVAPRKISGDINKSAILSTSRRGQPLAQPKAEEDDLANLAEVVLVKEAFADPDEKVKWMASMLEENNLFISKNTGTLVPPPNDDKVIGGMWRLVRKKNKFGDVVCRKSQWVCFGNHQEKDRHYYDTYSSVGCNKSLKVLLAMAVQFNLSVFHFDVKTAFLYGKIDATIHVAQVSGFEVPGKEHWVWRLNKSLYGTKQAPRCWKKHLTDTLAP